VLMKKRGVRAPFYVSATLALINTLFIVTVLCC
jgi:hypothetical protein